MLSRPRLRLLHHHERDVAARAQSGVSRVSTLHRRSLRYQLYLLGFAFYAQIGDLGTIRSLGRAAATLIKAASDLIVMPRA
jgi:hypothetical protein